jgi:DNA (cytosine-5)-methyltransferase 1
MKHYGDITKLSGYDLPIVDVITGGSPCQDLSVAGNRQGLDGERSSLFLEQIRIVKEMREHDTEQLRSRRADVDLRFIRPRFLIWENVPGALSSGKPKGGDFQRVLTEIVKIIEPDAPDVPLPEKGKWSKSGCLYDELGRWSIAWRIHDAQFWGVPQRRKRIALVADFAGLSAPEVLFERKGLQWYPDEGKKKGQGTAGDPQTGTGKSDKDDGVIYL